VRELSRRAVVAAAGAALSAGSGCLFGSAHRGPAERVSGQVRNDTPSSRTVTVRLVTNSDETDFAETYDLEGDENAEFEVQSPTENYTLAVETSDGVTGETDWDVIPCTNYVTVSVGSERVDFRFTQC